MRDWIDTARDLLQQKNKIEVAAATWRDGNRQADYLFQGKRLLDGKHFRQENRSNLPLSETANQFVDAGLRARRNARFKLAALLCLPLLLVVIPIEIYQRQQLIDRYRKQIDEGATPAHAVEFLVTGCWARDRAAKMPSYWVNRRYGHCLPLRAAYLYSIDLNGMRLRSADFSEANLYLADLGNADLAGTNFQQADLRYAILRDSNLSGANLSEVSVLETRFEGASYTDNSTKQGVCKHMNFSHPCPTLLPSEVDPLAEEMVLIQTLADFEDTEW